MSSIYRFGNLAEMYNTMSTLLLSDASDVVCPRGKETRELITPVIHIEHPHCNLAYLKERKFNIVYALVETLMLVSKKNELKYFTEFNKNMSNFSDDGKTLNGAYGYRIADKLDDIIEKLKSDKDSRQAIVNIYNNDFTKVTKDTPCTIALHFIIRNNKLNLITYMRSNDIIWGTPYDIFMFTNLQRFISFSLGIDMGWYRHIPTSLHVYKEHYDLLSEMKKCRSVSSYFPFNLDEIKIIAKDYTDFIDDGKIHNTNILKIENISNEESQRIRNMFYNEKCFRDEIWASQNGYSISSFIPYWAKDFTHRWFKEQDSNEFN